MFKTQVLSHNQTAGAHRDREQLLVMLPYTRALDGFVDEELLVLIVVRYLCGKVFCPPKQFCLCLQKFLNLSLLNVILFMSNRQHLSKDSCSAVGYVQLMLELILINNMLDHCHNQSIDKRFCSFSVLDVTATAGRSGWQPNSAAERLLLLQLLLSAPNQTWPCKGTKRGSEVVLQI